MYKLLLAFLLFLASSYAFAWPDPNDDQPMSPSGHTNCANIDGKDGCSKPTYSTVCESHQGINGATWWTCTK
jgi:hypothetical protein